MSTESASGDPDPTTAPAVTELPPDTPRVRIDGPAPTQEPMTTLVLGHGRDPGSARALQVAADLAGRLHAHLHVVHGVDLDDYPIDPDAADWDQQARRALAEQHDAVETVLAGTAAGWTYHTSRAEPAALIVAVAEEHDALMVIVGTRGEGFGAAVERLLGRSVSHGVIAGGHRPVLVVPAAP